MDGLPLTFRCPPCGVAESRANTAAPTRVREFGLCQGCRAARSLRRHPELASLFVVFWRCAGFPESPSWLDTTVQWPAPVLPLPETDPVAAGDLAH